MNMTRKPVTSVQMKFDAMRFWPTALTRSSSVSPFFMSLTGMSLTVPVMTPAGSPLARSSAFGADTFFKSAVVIAVAAGSAAGAVTGVGALATPSPVNEARTKARMCFVIVSSPSALPDSVFLVSGVDDSHNPAETDCDAGEHQDQPHARCCRDTDT